MSKGLDREMNRLVHNEWKAKLNAELSKPSNQIEIQKAIVEGPYEYHESVERSERESEDENMTIEQQAALDERVKKRMLTESPALMEHKLRNDGGKIVPDHDAYEREKRRKEFMEF